MYGLPAVAVVLFAVAIGQYAWIGQWLRLYRPMALATVGFMSAVASHEMADWTGTFGWSYDNFWSYPPTWVQVFGFGVLIYADLFGFRR
jgi:hypothetical protein